VEAQEARLLPAPASVALPKPARRGGLPLMDALARRHSSREFSRKEIPDAVLSSLLWAAFGINRPESHKRTAPSAHDWEEMDIYIAMAKGLYVYDAKAHALNLVAPQDLRARTGIQPYVGDAPVNLVYVADLTRMSQASPEEKQWYSGPDAGFIAQNVYLFCASEGLATVVRALVDRPLLSKAMGLKPQQQIVLAQSVGFPATV
jgi:SagB-type dehydrogenase family enzyme